MSVDIINTNTKRIKEYVINLYNKANQTEVNPDLDQLVFENIGDDKVILQDPATKRGVVFKKIDITSLFTKIIDLRPFKEKREMSLGGMHPSNVDRFNDKHNHQLVSPEVNILKSPTGFPVEDVKEFVLFCRVFGFYELDIGDVTLIRSGETLYISINDTQPLYYGVLEVKV